MSVKVFAPSGCPFEAAQFEVLGQLCGVSVEVEKSKGGANQCCCAPHINLNGVTVTGTASVVRCLARMRADAQLLGRDFASQGVVDTWLECACSCNSPAEHVELMDKYLLNKTYLGGDRLSVADVVMCAKLQQHKPKQGKNVSRWMKTLLNLPAFRALEKAAGASGGSGQNACSAGSGGSGGVQSGGGGVEGAEQVEKKQPNPLDALPPPKMDMDEWKRTYSNSKDLYKEAMPWFWKNYDPADYSLWFVHYEKAEDEGKVAFMTSNLLSGFLQRCDKMRKYAFGVMNVMGENGSFDIDGCLMFRGKEVIQEMKEHPSYEYHKFKPVDISDPKQKQLVEDFWCAEDTIDGKKISDGKVFK